MRVADRVALTSMSLSQRWDPNEYARNARFVAELGVPLVDLLAPAPGERVLDLGCGDGVLSLELQARGASVVGVDGSPEQVAAALAAGVDARLARAEELPFDGEFDAVFSNAVLHWVKDAAGAARSMYRALVPGGRLVAELGAAGNVQTLQAALHAALLRRALDPARHDPWYFPTAAEYAAVLTAAGFEVAGAEAFARPTPLPTGVSGWLVAFAGSFLSGLTEQERDAVVAEVEAATAPTLLQDGVWTADYVRLRVFARKPA